MKINLYQILFIVLIISSIQSKDGDLKASNPSDGTDSILLMEYQGTFYPVCNDGLIDIIGEGAFQTSSADDAGYEVLCYELAEVGYKVNYNSSNLDDIVCDSNYESSDYILDEVDCESHIVYTPISQRTDMRIFDCEREDGSFVPSQSCNGECVPTKACEFEKYDNCSCSAVVYDLLDKVFTKEVFNSLENTGDSDDICTNIFINYIKKNDDNDNVLCTEDDDDCSEFIDVCDDLLDFIKFLDIVENRADLLSMNNILEAKIINNKHIIALRACDSKVGADLDDSELATICLAFYDVEKCEGDDCKGGSLDSGAGSFYWLEYVAEGVGGVIVAFYIFKFMRPWIC